MSPTTWQRLVRWRLHRLAGKASDDPLTPEDWEAFYAHHTATRGAVRVLSALPRAPRCRLCGAPFAGLGSQLLGPFGYVPSRKNPHFCATCIEFAPPGGMTMDVGVVFADVRGFTALAERSDPHRLSLLLHRFYADAEAVFFPQALIDKTIGDAVMALYIPMLGRLGDPERQMVVDAQRFLRRVGYGAPAGPYLHVGVGMAYGEAFVGNIGSRWVNDFTAVGDVVNTAARLQEQAVGGEILIAADAGDPGALRIAAKGKSRPVAAGSIMVPEATA